MTGLAVGATAGLTFSVKPEDLAEAVGSGDVPVLATPTLIAWLEAASVAAVAATLPQGSTTVGTRVEVDHLAASPLHSEVLASATVLRTEGKIITFECTAVATPPGGAASEVGRGTITRAIVNRERFIQRNSAH